jgi:hypothetical protein
VGAVITLDDAAAMALALPEVTEGMRWGTRTWSVNGKTFAWERPLSKADRKRYGAAPMPEGDLLAVQVGDLGDPDDALALDEQREQLALIGNEHQWPLPIRPTTHRRFHGTT